MTPLRVCTSSLVLPGRALRRAANAAATVASPIRRPPFARRYHPAGSLLVASPEKSDSVREREELSPRRSEGTKSGTDDQVAEKADAAFNPKKTDPAVERESAARESNGNPLEASGANQEFSRSQNPAEESADKTDKKTRSRGHGGKKHGKVSPM